jgi:hypothetical protein
MAQHPVSHHADNDYVEHEKSYSLFLGLMKWGTIATIAIVLFIGSVTQLVPWALTFFLIILMLAASRVV